MYLPIAIPTRTRLARLPRLLQHLRRIPHKLHIATFLLATLWLLVSRDRTQTLSTPLATCQDKPPAALHTFDPHTQRAKASGQTGDTVETRHQEDVWDTILLDMSALYPAWSDRGWKTASFGRGVIEDVGMMRGLVESRLGGRDVVYAHRRLDRLRGLQFAVGVKNGGAMLVRVGIGGECRVSVTEKREEGVVYVLLPYARRSERLRMFLKGFRELVEKGENAVLVVSVLRGSGDAQVVERLKGEVFGGVRGKVKDSVVVVTNEGDARGAFSRGVAIREAAKVAPKEGSVLFQCDVDMMLTAGFFERCRGNSMLGAQVYYPVFYSLYPYANKKPMVAERNGFWRKTSFGMVCIRKGDFEKVGAFDDAERRFQGWGSEDVFQFESIRNHSRLVAFRAVDPGLLHRWHTKECDPMSPLFVDCMKTNFVTMGHPVRIGPALLKSLPNVHKFLDSLERDV